MYKRDMGGSLRLHSSY